MNPLPPQPQPNPYQSPENMPSGYTGVWPPPINDSRQGAPQYAFRFTFLYNRVTGNITDYRQGNLSLTPDGIWINGMAMPRSEIYTPIMVVGVLLSVLIAVIAHLIMRYGALRQAQELVPWTDITQVILVPNRNRIGIAYKAANYKGTVKPFCLCASLTPQDYDYFAQTCLYYVPNVTAEGRLRSGTSVVLWVVLLALIAAMVGVCHMD